MLDSAIDVVNRQYSHVQCVVGLFADCAMMDSMDYASIAEKEANLDLRENSRSGVRI